MTACKSAEVKPIADGAAKNAHSATKIASIVECATKCRFYHACWGHPKPRNDRTAVIKKSAYAEIKTKETPP